MSGSQESSVASRNVASRDGPWIGAVLIAAACWAADFSQAHRFGLLADDWALMGNALWNRSLPFSQFLRDLFFYSWEGRPLRTIEFVLLRGAYTLGGLTAAFLVLWAVLSASGILLSRLVARRLGGFAGLISGLLLILYPAVTTHVWAATLMAMLGILYVLLAMEAFQRRWNVIAGLLILAAFYSYELSAFPFVLAPWFRDGGRRRSLRDGLLVFGGALAVYVAWRLWIFPRFVPDIRAAVVAADRGGPLGIARTTLTAALRAVPTLMFRWPAHAFGVAANPEHRSLFAAVFLAITPVSALLSLRQGPAPKRNLRDAIVLCLFGVAAIMAGAALSAFAAPRFTDGPLSRHNIASQIGAVVFWTGGITLLFRFLHRRILRVSASIAFCAVLAAFFTFRYAVQESWVRAGEFQRGVIQRMVEDLGPLPPHTAVLVRYPTAGFEPSDPAVMPPFISGMTYEMETIFRLIYDESMLAGSFEEEKDVERASLLSPLGRVFRERPKLFSVVSYTLPAGDIKWFYRRTLDPREHLISPSGPAWDFVK